MLFFDQKPFFPYIGLMQNNVTLLPGFYGLGIAPKLLEILDKQKYKIPTPIQLKSIPIALEGKDLMGIAQTGTGKTLAFGVPVIQRIAKLKGRALIILPTRELALQVDETFKKLGHSISLRTVVMIGGASMNNQIRDLKKNPHILIATPGRLIDHLEQHTLRLDDVNVLVLDEADRMLDMGFAPQIKRILQQLPKERQTMLFSATMPGEIMALANSYMKLPVRVEIARAGTMAEKVSQELFIVKKEDKLRLLEKLLTENHGTMLVFSRTKHGAKKIAAAVRHMGHRAAEIHSNRSLAQRREALDGFKNGVYRVLVATDIAARGIDVKDIELVLNFDLPDQPDDYVHRIGRTGRAGMPGHAISFATPDQKNDVRDIERLTRKILPVSRLPELPPARHIMMNQMDQDDVRSYRQSHHAQTRSGSRPSRAPYQSHRPSSRPPYQPHRPSSSRSPSTHAGGRRNFRPRVTF